MSINSEIENQLQEVYFRISMRRFDQALDGINSLLQGDPGNKEALFLMAFCYFYTEKLQDAYEICKDLISEGIHTEECNHILAQIYQEKKEYIFAEEHYLEALRLNPQNASILADYGDLMFTTGHESKAFNLVDEALRIDPYNNRALDFYLKYNLSKNDKLANVDTLRRIMDSSNDEFSKLVKIGISQAVSGNYRQARETFRQAYIMDPTNTEFLSILNEQNINSFWYFVPIQIVDKIGGPKVLWPVMFISVLILRSLKLDTAFTTIIIIYIIYAVYTWTTLPVRKFLERRIRD